MLYVVTGGSGSGKSEFAENMAVSLYENSGKQGRLLYVATMQPFDEECVRRIVKHQNMRKEKGFSTIECYHHLERVRIEDGDVLLLECMSNLLANEMYDKEGQVKGDEQELQVWNAIIAPLFRFAKRAAHVVVVTNEVFSAGLKYEEESKQYIRLLGQLNRQLAKEAEQVVEVVYGIPIKG